MGLALLPIYLDYNAFSHGSMNYLQLRIESARTEALLFLGISSVVHRGTNNLSDFSIVSVEGVWPTTRTQRELF